MKEDVLEQIVEDYLQFKGYFTRHNVKFGPDQAHPQYVFGEDKTPSDVDVIGFHPHPPSGVERVIVVTCKSRQAGFNPNSVLAALRKDGKIYGKRARSSFRELWTPKWSVAFHSTIAELTGESTFSYRIAVTRLQGIGRADTWAEDPTIKANLRGCSFDFLTLEEMWATMLKELNRTPASSEMGRLAQLLKAAGLTAPAALVEPSVPVPGSHAAIAEGLEGDT